MVEEHDRIMNKLFAKRDLRAIKFEVLKLSESQVRQKLSLRRCSMLGDLVIVQDRLIRSIFRKDAKIASSVPWYEWDNERQADLSDPGDRARINAEIHRSYVEEQDATVVSSAENAPSEQVLMNEVAGAGAISRDRDANRGNGIVRSNGLADGHIPVATQATLSTQTTTTSLCYSSTPVVTSALGKSYTQGDNVRGRVQYGPLFCSAPLWQQPLQWDYYYALRMRGVRLVPADHGLSAKEHAQFYAERTPPLLHRDDIGDLLEPQEKLHGGRKWYCVSQNFDLDSMSEYKTHDFSRECHERINSPPDRKRRRVEEANRRSLLDDF